MKETYDYEEIVGSGILITDIPHDITCSMCNVRCKCMRYHVSLTMWHASSKQ